MPTLRLGSIFDKQITDFEAINLQQLAIKLISNNANEIDENKILTKLKTLENSAFSKQNIPSSIFFIYLYVLIWEPLKKLLHKAPKAFISFLTIAIMVTTGLTNAGFIILLFTGATSLTAISLGATLGLGLALAIPGGLFSGYAQKGIYQASLEGLCEMIMDGTFAKIARENPKLFALATFCALFSFVVNLGLGLFGMSIFFATGGAPLIILAVLFALANAALVYYTALDQINKKHHFTWEKVIAAIKPTLLNGLTFLFGVIATFGLIMTFFPGATEITDKLKGIASQVIFYVLLGFAVLTEVFYSWVKSCHLANNICALVNKRELKDDDKEDLAVAIINASVNCALGTEGGIEFAEKINVNENNTTVQDCLKGVGAGTSFGWSATCSATPPKENPTQDTITHQFSNFIKNNISKPNFNENALRGASLTF